MRKNCEHCQEKWGGREKIIRNTQRNHLKDERMERARTQRERGGGKKEN